MTEESRRKLAQFAASGGKVLWVDNTPTSRKPAGSIAVRLDEVSAHLTPVVGIEPANKLIRVCRRRIADGSLYLITNEALGPVSCSVTFSETLPMVGLDLETGACYRPSRAVRSESGWSLPLELDFAGSCAIMFTKEKLRLKSEPPRAGSVLLALGEGWSGRRVKSFVHGEDDIEVHDLLEELPVPIYLGDWRSKFGEGFSGDVEYSVSFDCTNDFARRATYLDLGEVRYVCRATLNGVDLGRRIWQPMLFPIKGKLRAGRNELRVAVTNTLANQYATTQVFEKYTAAQMGPYTDKESRYERESLPSGLYGPVVIRE